MGRDQGYVHLQKEEQKMRERDDEEKVAERRQKGEAIAVFPLGFQKQCVIMGWNLIN